VWYLLYRDYYTTLAIATQVSSRNPKYQQATRSLAPEKGNLHDLHCYGFLHETPLICVIILGCNITASLLLIATHMQSYHIHTKYIINIYLPTCVNVFVTLLKVDNMCGVK
jgi:hypothetical protein